METALGNYKQLIDDELTAMNFGTHPEKLYEPIKYIMALGGKRLRPLLTMLAYELFNEHPEKIIRPALAVELFHNFTLMHDDIMDQAPIRRGKATVHEQWNNNVAILSGDVMLVKVYELFMEAPEDKLPTVLKAFNRCATQVCEGQQLDMDFEDLQEVPENLYLSMIKQKTAVLLGFSLELGGILGSTSQGNCTLLRNLGINLGLAFQLKDDLLDVYGDTEKFGKLKGGDIVANKKTFLLIKALEMTNKEEKDRLQYWLRNTSAKQEEKIADITKIYDDLNLKEITEKQIDHFYREAIQNLDTLDVPPSKKDHLSQLTKTLMTREQ